MFLALRAARPHTVGDAEGCEEEEGGVEGPSGRTVGVGGFIESNVAVVLRYSCTATLVHSLFATLEHSLFA